MPQPSFFIVGAPKCGTTALCKYLDRHPQIFIPLIKELHYFDTDLKTKKAADTLEKYLNLFADHSTQTCGEGSPTYLFSKEAARNIHTFNPAAKIIIMLREPVSMMYSFHSQHLFNGSSETEEDFQTALSLESERKAGRQIPARCKEPQILFYRDFARYAPQVKRYLDIFGKANTKIILFEEFTQQTQQIYQETLNFIGVDPNFKTEFSVVNSSKKVKSRLIQDLVKYPPAPVLQLGKYLVPLPQSARRKLLEAAKAKLKKFNTQHQPRTPLNPELRYQLAKEFEEDITILETLIERDLSHWRPKASV